MPYDAAAAGRRIRALREHQGWSQRELARRAAAAGLPVSHGTISQLELGHTKRLSLDIVRALAVALKWPGYEAMLASESLNPPATEPQQVLQESPLSWRYAGEHAPGGGREGPARAAQGGNGTGGLGERTPVLTYRGYALGARADPRDPATWAGALSDSRRRALQVGERTTQRVGSEDTGFAVLVQDSSLSHVATEQGFIEAGWTLFVDTTHPELLLASDRVVIAMSRAGELVGGWLERDPEATDDGWLIVDAHRTHAVAPDGLVGVVAVEAPPYSTLTWRRPPPPAGPPGPIGPAYLAAWGDAPGASP